MKIVNKKRVSSFSFLPWGYLNTEKYSVKLADYEISELCNLILVSKEFKDLIKDSNLENYSGRNKNQYLLESSKDLVRDNELLHISISILNSDKEELEILSTNLTTNYTGTKKGKINQKISIEKSSNTPQIINFSDFSRIIPAKIKHFRLGLLKYKSKFISSTFGMAPSITGQLLLDIENNHLELEIREEGLKSAEEKPWKNSNLVDSIIKNITF
jgi:hypothetical protein